MTSNNTKELLARADTWIKWYRKGDPEVDIHQNASSITGSAYNIISGLKDHLSSMGDGWHDISTAPKDGTQILCCERWWLSKAGHKMGGHIYIARWNEDKWLNSSGFRQPTDWMQLPYLPQPPENS